MTNKIKAYPRMWMFVAASFSANSGGQKVQIGEEKIIGTEEEWHRAEEWFRQEAIPDEVILWLGFLADEGYTLINHGAASDGQGETEGIPFGKAVKLLQVGDDIPGTEKAWESILLPWELLNRFY